jgi:PAS domain S-box-containing protein
MIARKFRRKPPIGIGDAAPTPRDIRALEMINAANRIVLHAADEAELMCEVCRACIEVGGYKLAWVGYAQDDAEQTVAPVAFGGTPLDYVLKAEISWGDCPHGHGTTGTAIRERRTMVNREFAVTAGMEPWRVNAEKAGLRSSVAIPLQLDDEVFAALTIYSEQTDAFDRREVKLLEEFAADLAFGARAIRTSIAKEEALKEIALQVRTIAAIKDAAPLGLLLIGADDRIISHNRLYLDFWGISEKAVANRTMGDLAGLLASKTLDPDAYLARAADIRSDRETATTHDVITLKDGRVLERYTAPVRLKDGAFVGRVAFVRDITLQRRIELNLRRVNRILLGLGGLLLLLCLLLVLRPYLSRANLFSSNGEFPLKPTDSLKAPYSAIALIESRGSVPMEDHGVKFAAQTRGTGFMVSPCYALSAYHVVLGVGPKAPDAQTPKQVWISLGARASTFLYDRVAGQVVRWSDFTSDWHNDWALIKVDGCPGKDRRIGWLPLAEGAFNPYQGPAAIAGYDSAYGMMVGQSDCSLGRMAAPMTIRHYCGSRPGLSGAPIFVRWPDLRVVGIAVREQNATRELLPVNDPDRANLATYVPGILASSDINQLITADLAADHGPDPGAPTRTAVR